MSKIFSFPFGSIYNISDTLKSDIHYRLHIMGSRSSVPTIKIPPQPCPDEFMNSMYDGYPGISSVHLVGSDYASCSSYCIRSTDCLTDVYIARFTHDGSLPSTAFNGVNNPFEAGMPIVPRRNFPMIEHNVLKFTLPLRIIDFRACNIFYIYLVLVLCTFLIQKKYTLAPTFLFPKGP